MSVLASILALLVAYAIGFTSGAEWMRRRTTGTLELDATAAGGKRVHTTYQGHVDGIPAVSALHLEAERLMRKREEP